IYVVLVRIPALASTKLDLLLGTLQGVTVGLLFAIAALLMSLSRSKLTVQPARSEPMDTGSLPIMTYEETVITGGSHAPTEFYPQRPAGPPLRRRDPSAPPPAPRPRPQVPRGAAADPVVLCRRAAHLALRCLPVLARRPLRRGGPAGPDRHVARLRRVAAPAQRRTGRELAPAPAPSAATLGRRPGLDPLSWPAPARPRGGPPLPGQ